MTVRDAIELGAAPAGCMLAFTLLGLGKEVPENIAGSLQHLAAGILLASIGSELLPVISAAEGHLECISAAVGFFSGVAILLIVGILLPEHPDDCDEYSDEKSSEVKRHRRSSVQFSSRRSMSVRSTAQQRKEEREKLSIVQGESEPLIGNSSQITSARSVLNPVSSFPAALLIAVSIDSFMDGLLIGLVTAAGGNAGPMLSVSLSVEMSFLGLTLATALQGVAKTKSIPAAILGPAILVGAAGLGGAIASILEHNPVFFVGLISFGTSALLFMVAEELLLEAHEGGGHIWWVDLQLYVGFFLSIMMDKFTG